VNHDEAIVNVQIYRGKRARRQVRKGVAAVAHFPEHEVAALSTRQRDAINHIQEQAKEIERTSREMAQLTSFLLTPTPTNPKMIRLVPLRPRDEGEKTGSLPT
jgi:hypothetical protein